jgi:uncharacterized protein involved in exopolysaccharide biosynthesis
MDEINLLDYLNILKRRKWTVVLTTAVTMLLAGIVLAVMPRTYEGETTLLFPEQADLGISPQLAQLAGFVLPGGMPSLSGADVYYTVLGSRTLAENVCKRLSLDRYGLDYEDLQDNITIEKPKEGGLILVCQAPTSWMRGHIAKGELRDHTAQLAADIANMYVSELRTYDRSTTLFQGKKNRLYIEDQLARTKTELSVAEEQLRKFQEAHPTLVPPDKGVAYAEKALALTSERTEAGIALQEILGQTAQARSTWAARAPEGVSPEAVIDSPTISDLRSQLANLEVQRATFLEDFTDIHPDVVSLDQQISKLKDEINSEVSSVISGTAGSASPAHQELLKQLVLLEVGRDGLESRQSAIGNAMADLEKQLSGLPVEEMAYARLIRDVKATEVVYTTLLAEHAKARVTEGRDPNSFVVLDEAVALEEPAKPRVILTLAAALMLGGMFGMMIVAVQGSSTGEPPT